MTKKQEEPLTKLHLVPENRLQIAELLAFRIIRLSKGDDRALPGLWGGEAEEAGHSD